MSNDFNNSVRFNGIFKNFTLSKTPDKKLLSFEIDMKWQLVKFLICFSKYVVLILFRLIKFKIII